MKVLALIEHLGHACYRYRIAPFAQALAERGVELEPSPIERGPLARAKQFWGARRFDGVILQRRLLPYWQLALLRRRARRLIFDFDDAIDGRDSYTQKGPRSRQRLLHFWATLQAADAVIAGNPYLEQRACCFVSRERVALVPTCVEPERYRPARHERRGGAARLVWIGQRSTMQSLDLLRPHLAAVAQRLPGLELRIISDAAPELPGVKVVFRRWSSQTEAEELAQGDIGVTFLPDDAWSQGKCGLRVLQFMAAGLPVVANPVAMNRQMVIPGDTGLLADTPEQWAAAIEQLAADPPRRSQMGAAGRRQVEQGYSVHGWKDRFADFVANAIRGRPLPGDQEATFPGDPATTCRVDTALHIPARPVGDAHPTDSQRSCRQVQSRGSMLGN
jgi:glycosyltransferase involved in cell wall biosynthesis